MTSTPGGPLLSRHRFLKGMAGAAGAAALLGPAGLAAAATSPMIRRAIPKSGETVPVIGLGTAQSFGYAGDAATFDARKAVIRTLIEGGATIIDTSPTYGSAEDVVGRALAALGMRKRAFIATKISIRGKQAGIDQHRQSVRDLRSGVVDLLQVHNLKDTEAHLATIRRL